MKDHKIKKRIGKGEKVAGIFLNIYLGVFALCLVYVMMQIFIFVSFTIPTESMMPAIEPGDKVIVEKASTGARLFDFRKINRGERTRIVRTPHWRSFRRGDILVFNFIYRNSWDSISMSWPRYYIKRSVGIPGDTVEIRDFCYYVNGTKQERYGAERSLQYRFPSDSVCRMMNLRGYMADLSDTVDRWTIKDYGPLVVPCKGMIMSIDSITFRRYKQIMEWESREPVTLNQGKVWLGSNPLDEYEFQGNYYFLAGDNVEASMDSRYWGLLPEEFIVGRARFIWWSMRGGKIKWNRLLKTTK